MPLKLVSAAVIAVVLLPISALARTMSPAVTVEVHGAVTKVYSQTAFDVGDTRITRDPQAAYTSGDVQDVIGVGSEVAIRGDWDPATHAVHARTIRVVSVENAPRIARN